MADIQHAIASGGACLKLALSGASLSAGSAAWCWLDDNSRALATLAAIIGAAVGIAGLWLQHRANRRRHALALEQHRIFMDRLLSGTHRDDPPQSNPPS